LAREGNPKIGIQQDVSFADKIRDNCLINKYSKLPSKNKLILTKNDNSVLEQLIRIGRKSFENSDFSNLIVNYDFLETEINSLLKKYSLDQFYDNLNKLMIVDVALFHDVDNPQQTFESLNATGKELEDGDLIRNFLLMNLPNDKQNEIYEKYWLPLEMALKDKLTYFFSNFLYMERQTSTNIKNLYKDFQKFFYENYDRDIIDKLADRLLTFAKYFSFLIGESSADASEDEDLKNAIVRLGRLGFDSYLPLLMPVFHEHKVGHEAEVIREDEIIKKQMKLPKEDFIAIVNVIESFLVRRSVCEVPTNSLNSIFRTLWPEVDKNRIKESIVSVLKSGEWNKRFPDNEEFADSLRNSIMYGKNFTKLILEELERYNNKEANSNFDSFQIEHILPQTGNDPDKLSDNWKIMLGEGWTDVRNTWVHKLGNLTLTGYNPEYRDYDFETKKTMENGYLASTLRLNQEIAKYTVWNEASIIDRAERLATIATSIWVYPVVKKNTEE
jgi:uncharacterized protein with ParB-like and HNH nuclease domain